MKLLLSTWLSHHARGRKYLSFMHEIFLPIHMGNISAGRDGVYKAVAEGDLRISDPPNRTEATGAIPASAVPGILRAMPDLRIPVQLPFPHVMDGGGGELRIEDASASLVIQWSGDVNSIECIKNVIFMFDAFARQYPLALD